MIKLAIFFEVDDAGEDTGRVQVADDGEDSIVYDTFDTEEEAEIAMAKMQDEFDQEDEAKSKYLGWEEEFLSCHSISKKRLRGFLVNVVII